MHLTRLRTPIGRLMKRRPGQTTAVLLGWRNGRGPRGSV